MAIDPFLSKCIAILKQSEVQREVKDLVKPLLDMMLNELYPYIYLSILECRFYLTTIFFLNPFFTFT